jgi:hypothetical protein
MTDRTPNLETALASKEYVRSINNAAKRAYATAYLTYLKYGGFEPTPPGGLSSMGAQAVRMRLGKIWREGAA